MQEISFFENYLKQFDLSLYGIKLKYDHSYRVMYAALELASTLNMEDNDMELVRVCSLLHDIGRFPQYTEFKSFRDIDTYDHGDKGYEVLKENGFTNEVLLNVVKNHNKLSIPDNIDEKSKEICKIIRDADKLDILRNQGLECTSDDYIITEDIIDIFRQHKAISNDIKIESKGNILSLLKMIAFIFDINYKDTIIKIKEEDLINKKIDLIYEKNKDNKIIELRNICNEYIESRL